MVRKAALLSAALLSVAASLPACAPIAASHGFQALDVKPTDLKIGEDTKSTTLERLGSPSATSTFDPNLWFYISQAVEEKAFYRPRVTSRNVVAVTFDATEKVKTINTYTLADGRVVAFNDRKTPTRGRELTILEQLLGNVGRGLTSGLGQREEDETPGGRRRE
jgi:outer membrane protein assembly factor BamE (lipoprotein component of BamABCDE complex)